MADLQAEHSAVTKAGLSVERLAAARVDSSVFESVDYSVAMRADLKVVESVGSSAAMLVDS